MNPAESGNLAGGHYLVEIAEACRKEADACKIVERTYHLDYIFA